VIVCCLSAATPAAADDVITLKDGERIEGLIVEADDASVLVRWGGGRAVITRRVPRRAIKTIRFAASDTAGLRELARRSEAQGDLRDAAEVLTIACGLNPDSAEDHRRRARCLRLAGKLDEASDAAALAARLEPEEAATFFEQAEVRLAARDYKRAAQHALDGLRRAGSGSIEGNWLLARAFDGGALPQDAIGAYRKVLQADPTHVGALERLTALLLSRQASLEAETVARDFVRASPDVRAGRVSLGFVLYRQGRYGEAVDAFRAATALGGAGYDRARIFLHCARSRSAGTSPALGLSPQELDISRELDPDLRRDIP